MWCRIKEKKKEKLDWKCLAVRINKKTGTRRLRGALEASGTVKKKRKKEREKKNKFMVTVSNNKRKKR